MKRFLGLDIGTNSVGAAQIKIDEANHEGAIELLTSRIIPSGGRQLDHYKRGKPLTNSKGRTVSECADRRGKRSARRNNERFKDRRSKLLLVFDVLGWNPVGLTYEIDDAGKYPKPRVLPIEPSGKKVKDGRLENTEVYRSYEMRHRAVNGELSLDELAKVFYQLNQRRGYQDIGLLDEEENLEEETTLRLKPNERRTTVTLLTCDATGAWNKKRKESRYTAEEGGKEIKGLAYIPFFEKYIGKTFEAIIATDKEGTDYLKIYNPGQWSKSREENNASLQGKTIGEKLFEEVCAIGSDSTLKHWDIALRKRVYDRKHYKNEFDRIWDAQQEHHAVLDSTPDETLQKIVEILIPKNPSAQTQLKAMGLRHILRNYIIFYQRPLKRGSKDDVAQCSLQQPSLFAMPDGRTVTKTYKALPVSHPLYQQFRIWSVINNLMIKDEKGNEIYIDDAAYKCIYNLFEKKEEVSPTDILKELKLPPSDYFTNYRKEALLKGNVTSVKLRKALKAEPAERVKAVMEDPAMLDLLWQILTYVQHKEGLHGALTTRTHNLNGEKFAFGFLEDTAQALAKIGLERKYGSLSAKAIKKLLPLMQRQNLIPGTVIDAETEAKLTALLGDGGIEDLNERLQSKVIKFASIKDFEGLRYDEAAELAYGAHTRPQQEAVYKTSADIRLLPQHSLRHPVVEEVVNETLKVVRDIWAQTGEKPDAIHIELARELQNSQKQRDEMYLRQVESRDRNNTVKATLQDEHGIANPTLRQIERYKLWKEQNMRCVYTNEYIEPANLFRTGSDGVYFYDVDHIIPKRRLFDDSFSNKVLCKRAANTAKDKRLARTFMETERVYDGLQNFDDFCDRIKELPKAKRVKLLMKDDEIPTDFIERQKKETQYITRRVIEELAKIVGSENIHTTTGGVTAVLRYEWGVEDIFKKAQEARYLKFEEKLRAAGIDKTLVTYPNGKLHIAEYSKRSDHRHHALDALVIACTSPKHIKYLNDLNKVWQDDSEKNVSLREFATELIQRSNGKAKRRFRKPWKNFCEEVAKHLDQILVSFKRKQFYSEWRENRTQAGTDESTGRPRIHKQATEVLAVKGEMHNQQPDGWRFIPGKPVKISVVLKKMESLSPTEQQSFIQSLHLPEKYRKQFSALLGDAAGDAKALKKRLAAQPFVNRHGKVLDVLPTYERRIIKRKKLGELDAKEFREIRDARLLEALLSHARSYNPADKPDDKLDLSEAFGTEGARLFNLNRASQGLMPVHSVQLIQQKKFDPLDPGSANRIIERKNSFNKRAVFNTSASAWNIIYERLGEHGARSFKKISLWDYAQSELEKESFVEPAADHQYVLFNTHSMMYMPDPDEDLASIDFSDKGAVFPKLYRFSRLSGEEWYFLPHISTEPLQLVTKQDEKDIVVREYGGSIADFEKDLRFGRKIKLYGIPVMLDRLGNVSKTQWRSAS